MNGIAFGLGSQQLSGRARPAVLHKNTRENTATVFTRYKLTQGRSQISKVSVDAFLFGLEYLGFTSVFMNCS